MSNIHQLKTFKSQVAEDVKAAIEEAKVEIEENGALGIAIVIIDGNGEHWLRCALTEQRSKIMAGLFDLLMDVQQARID